MGFPSAVLRRAERFFRRLPEKLLLLNPGMFHLLDGGAEVHGIGEDGWGGGERAGLHLQLINVNQLFLTRL